MFGELHLHDIHGFSNRHEGIINSEGARRLLRKVVTWYSLTVERQAFQSLTLEERSESQGAGAVALGYDKPVLEVVH